ncbi:MAG: hypothetical protein IPH20_11170 [Bacteroidales bacterium]|nr:hypothetical protein [Bacteroidales bacterium]
MCKIKKEIGSASPAMKTTGIYNQKKGGVRDTPPERLIKQRIEITKATI